MLVSVAGLGVLNSVVLDTRERVHDLGVCKALGDWLKHPAVIWTHLHDSYQTSFAYLVGRLMPIPGWTVMQYVTLAFTSRNHRSLVTANPTYEAAWEAAALNGAEASTPVAATMYSAGTVTATSNAPYSR